MLGPKKQDIWPRINKLKEQKLRILAMNDTLKKRVKIVLSKLIFDVKNQRKHAQFLTNTSTEIFIVSFKYVDSWPKILFLGPIIYKIPQPN